MQRLETPLTDADIDRLDELLSSIHEPLQPMDASAVDGYLCGVLLQPVTILWADVLPALFDADARSGVPPGVPAAVVDEVSTLAQRRHAELAAAIAGRRWFDPWIFEPDDDDDTPSAAQLLWVSGFSIALERWPQLLKLSNPALQEPLAVLFASVHPDDLEDADDLLPLIETLEPPSTLEEAAEDLVRSVLLLADVSRPLPRAAKGAPRRAGAAGGGAEGGAEGGAGGGAGRGAGGPPSGLKRTAAARRHPGPGPRSQKGRRG